MEKSKAKATNTATVSAPVETKQAPAAHGALSLVTKPMTYLEPLEEKVVRMRHGLMAGPDVRLERIGQASAETQASLLEIEARGMAFLQASRDKGDVKSKIIDALKDA